MGNYLVKGWYLKKKVIVVSQKNEFYKHCIKPTSQIILIEAVYKHNIRI